MSIPILASLTPPTAPVLTPESIATAISRNNALGMQQLKNRVTAGFNAIWHNPSSDPGPILAAFGTNAAALFAKSYQAQQLIQVFDPTWAMLVPPVPYTIHDDGTVTVP